MGRIWVDMNSLLSLRCMELLDVSACFCLCAMSLRQPVFWLLVQHHLVVYGARHLCVIICVLASSDMPNGWLCS